MSFEQPAARKPDLEIYMFEDEAYFSLLRKLPTESAILHANKIIEEKMSDEAAITYLNTLLEKNDAVNTESQVGAENNNDSPDTETRKNTEGQISEQTDTAVSFDQLSEVFYRKVSTLKNEMYSEWMSKFDNLEHEDDLPILIEKLDTLLQKRKLNSVAQDLEIHEDVDIELRQEILNLHESIKNTFGDTNYFLGNGATAEVYTLPISPHLCVKYITNQEAYNENNYMRKEYGFLDQLHNFKHEGVRTPHPYFIRIHPGDEGHSYGMEKIEGEDLSWILQHPEENINLVRKLKEIDRKVVESSLISYVEEMHERFNITHNDLFKRNIMCDTNGNFYIIDFGKAKVEDLGEDHEVFRKSDIAIIRSEIRDFFLEIDKIDINDIID